MANVSDDSYGSDIPTISTNKVETQKLKRMRHRDNKKRCMFYPEDPFKDNWDVFVMVILVFTCIVTPYRVALIEENDLKWSIINYTIDTMFFLDIIFVFNNAYYDDNFAIVESRCDIARSYFFGWFWIDTIAIIPFEAILSSTASSGGPGINGIVKIARIGRMYKLIKLTRLLKVLKVLKEKKKLSKYMKEFMQSGIGFERLFFFVIMFLMLCPIVSCLFIMVAAMSEGENWIQDGGYADLHHEEKYLTSFYFTVTTITTVGYGDIGPVNNTEKIFCVSVMIIGVISFSFASGSLASIIFNNDSQQA